MKQLRIDNYNVTIYNEEKRNCPIIYTNTINGENYVLWMSLSQAGLDDFVLVTITNLNWDVDMAPWYCPPCSPGDTACYGGADAYLEVLVSQIVPQVENLLKASFTHRILAGYSLAGLFAVYSLYKTSLFDEVVSGSGSFWFPDFVKFAQSHEMKVRPQKMYFSLGRQESHSKTPMFNTVQVRTEELVEYYKKMGLDVCFVLEPGNHFTDPSGRMVRGIRWILEDSHLKNTAALPVS